MGKNKDIENVIVQPYRHSGESRNDGGELDSGAIKSTWLIAEAQSKKNKLCTLCALSKAGGELLLKNVYFLFVYRTKFRLL